MIIDTMLAYYGTQGTKSCIPTTSVPGENPIGALALVCTAVGTHLAHCHGIALIRVLTGQTCIDNAHPWIFHQGTPVVL